MAEPKLKSSIAIIGCGDVGSTLAYALLLNPIVNDVILVDPKTALLHAQVRDLNDATYRGTTATRVRAGTHKDAGQADIVIITAGAKQKPGTSRVTTNILPILHIKICLPLSSSFSCMNLISDTVISSTSYIPLSSATT
jgi:L-lactate dehydrogenase